MAWEGTPADPASPTWEQYQSYGSGPIPEDEWAKYARKASSVIDDMTLGRAAEVTDLDVLDVVERAVFRVADVLYDADNGIISEKVGSYSYTRQSVPTMADARHEAVTALAMTGLTYRGL